MDIEDKFIKPNLKFLLAKLYIKWIEKIEIKKKKVQLIFKTYKNII